MHNRSAREVASAKRAFIHITISLSISATLSVHPYLSKKSNKMIDKLQFERKAMVGEPKSYHKTPETSYLKEGFSGIQNAAMVLISSDQINEV